MVKSSNTRLLLGLGAVGIAFVVLTIWQTWQWTSDQIEEMSDQQARLLIEFDNAVRTYVAGYIRPEMEKRVGKDEFIPEAMSTSFIARNVFEKVAKAHPDYLLRFPSTNPRNPSNKANPQEESIIRYFEQNPDAEEWSGYLSIDGAQYYARAMPRRFKAECLHCHGVPEDAPSSLVKRYGPTAGFGRKIGQLSIDLVGIPMTTIYATARNSALERLGAALLLVSLFLGAIALLIQSDILQRRRSEHDLKASESRYRSLWECASEGFCLHEIVCDENGNAVDYRLLDVNPAYERILGLRAEDVVGKLGSEVYNSTPPPYLDIYSRVAQTGVSESFETSYTPMGRHFSISAFSPLPGQFATAFSDVSDQKKVEAALIYQSTHDSLTDLPKRLFFDAELQRRTKVKGGKRGGFTLLYLDLDKFKLINDTLGHDTGDLLLVAVSSRLQACIRSNDILARMGGDEFTVLMPGLRSRSQAESVASRIIDSISRPFDIAGDRFVIGVSMGLAEYPADGTNATELLKHADAAMYSAKQAGRGTFRWYTGHVERDNQTRIEMERDLRQALDGDQFTIHYQPIISLSDGAIRGAEALLRWEHPEKGMVSPSLFIRVAEEMGLIRQIGDRVLREACLQAAEWHGLGLSELRIGVNVSTAQISHCEWIESVRSALSESGLDPSCLNLELTETDFASDYAVLGTALREAAALGVSIAIDDFGMGYSSLSRLRDFPALHLKIDGSFVRDIERKAEDKALLRSIIDMAHSQGIQVTAEWVETEAQMEILRECGCDYAQGYFISPALTAQQFLEFARRLCATSPAADRAA
jgi:diguanylate cyclase (GGDEF)-like protein/PAS domain S-box-containing protein